MAQQPPGGFGSPNATPHLGEPYATPRPPTSGNSGLVIALGVVVVIVVIVGALGILAVIGFRRYMVRAKTMEAMVSLRQIARSAEAQYQEEGRLCPSALEPVPREGSAVSAKKYQSSTADWQALRTDAGFGCLRFDMNTPQYYQYDYRSTGSSFEGIAKGDLDGDGEFSRFSMGGRVAGGKLVVDPEVTSVHPDE